ncbi:MAG: efflux RND transporter periplasmic adaptor subunit [Desulfomonilaceae bacterium]
MHACSQKKIRWYLLFSLLILFGCGQRTQTFTPPPPPEVTISLPEKKQVTDYLEFTGNTQAFESVEIRARVQGFLDKMNFVPGQEVKAGDLLFVIDPRPFQARVDQQEANLKVKEAALSLAQVKEEKSANLLKTSSISEIAFLEDKANRDMALAQKGAAKADLQEAKLQLDYTQVRSPIDGRVGRNVVDLGNLVGAQERTLLTNVVNDSSVYAYFNLSENDLLRLSRLYASASDRANIHRPQAPCFLGLADEKDFPREGKIDFVDTQVDPGTGTLTVRALFPNKDGLLLPGLFVRVRVPLQTSKAFLVPNVAVAMDQGGHYLLIVDQNNVVKQKPVTLGRQVGEMRVIATGISEKDWVIVNGIQLARPGEKVKPIKEGSKTHGEAESEPHPVASK